MGAARGLQGQVGVINQSRAQVVNGSLRFDSTQTQYLSRTPGSAGNRRTWTWSGWYKRGKLAPTRPFLFGCDTGTGGNDFFAVEFESSGDKLQIQDYGSGSPAGQAFVITSQVFRDPSAWYHIVIAVDTTQATNTDRIKVYVNGTRVTAFSQYDTWTRYYTTKFNRASETSIGNLAPSFGASGAFDGMVSQVYFIDGQALTPSSFGFTDPLTNTWRPKKFSGSYTLNPDGYGIKWSDYVTGAVYSSDYYNGLLFDGDATDSTVLIAATTQTFTPPSPIPVNSLLRVFVAKNGGGSTFTVNGTSYAGSTTEPGSWVTISGATQLSSMTWGTSGFNMERPSAIEIDGKILVDYQGTNSFYLPFDTDGAGDIGIGTDRSGRGNHWTTNNFVTTAAGIQTNPNIMPDSPSGISFSTAPTSGIGTTTGMTKPSNYCTLNPLAKGSYITLSNGNLQVNKTTSDWNAIFGTIGVSSGKWYAELTAGGSGSVGDMFWGVCSSKVRNIASLQDDATERAKGMLLFCDDGKYQLDGNARTTYSSSITTNDTLAIAYDLDTDSVTFYKNGTNLGSINVASSPLSTETIIPVFIGFNVNATWFFNWGQKPFKYAPPAGFLPLCTANLPRPTTDAVVRPDKYVGIVTYTGNGSTQSINVGFKPDLVWIKSRNNAINHALFDIVRGVNKTLISSGTGAEDTSNTFGAVSAFNSDGFTVAKGSTDGFRTNESAYTYVAWCWKAGGGGGGYSFWKDDIGYSTAAAAGLTAGTITPTGASVNTKSGFSIIKYTGTDTDGDSVPHGLSSTPSFILIKDLSETTNWRVWHSVLGYSGITNILILNSTAGSAANNDRITTVSSSTFTLTQSGGTGGGVNKGGNSYIAYCWAEIPGFSKFGSYTGNNSADGPMVVTGFRPRWIMVKRTDTSGYQWNIWDTARNTYNVAGTNLWADDSEVEFTSANYEADFLSNGFKMRNTHAGRNASGGTYIYAAYAEAPAQNLFGGQSTAR